jgi:hypothetical protein
MIRLFVKAMETNLITELEVSYFNFIYHKVYNEDDIENILNEEYLQDRMAFYEVRFKEDIFDKLFEFNKRQNYFFLNQLVSHKKFYLVGNNKIRFGQRYMKFKIELEGIDFDHDDENLIFKLTEREKKIIDLSYDAFMKGLLEIFNFIDRTKEDFRKGIISSEAMEYMPSFFTFERPTHTITDDINVSVTNSFYEKTSLNRNQTTLLFHFLSQNKVILDFDKKSMAKLLYYLTGHSETNLIKLAFPNIENMKNGRKSVTEDKYTDYSDSIAVQKLLMTIIEDIDSYLPKELKIKIK